MRVFGTEAAVVRWIHLYLAVYFLLVIAAGITLWRAAVFSSASRGLLVLAGFVSVALGLLLAASFSRPRSTSEK